MVVVVVTNTILPTTFYTRSVDTTVSKGLRTREQARVSILKEHLENAYQRKIANQALILKQRGLLEYKRLQSTATVKSGDSDNRERRCSEDLWTALLGSDFVRSKEVRPQSTL